MFSVRKDRDALTFRTSSDLSVLDRILELATDFAADEGYGNAEILTSVLRELISNAVIHGNHRSPDLGVQCTVRYLPSEEFMVEVEDEGKGVPPDAFRKATASKLNHGFDRIKAWSSAITFNRKRNRVAARLSLKLPVRTLCHSVHGQLANG